MAHESEKKRAKAAAATKQLYTQITIALYILWFVGRVLWRWQSFGFTSVLGIAYLSIVNYLCLSSIVKAAEYGTPYETWQDVLFVNWFVQFLAIFTGYAWLAWLVIPGYGLYQYGPMVARMIGLGSGGSGAGGGELSEAERKRGAKKERQASRGHQVKQSL